MPAPTGLVDAHHHVWDLERHDQGWLQEPALADTLDALQAAPGGAHLKALRHLVQGEADPAWLQRPDVERGLATVARRGLRYDVLVHHQLPQAVRLAQRNPQLRLVLDHAGKPPLAGGDLRQWEQHIRQLAAHENVACKVSGLITEADRERWTVHDLRPAWQVLLSAFGPQRLMFGSDWPVCRLAGGWNRWALTVGVLLDDLTAAQAEAVLATTAREFYALSPDPLSEPQPDPDAPTGAPSERT